MINAWPPMSRLAACARLTVFGLLLALASSAWLGHAAAARVDEVLGALDDASMRYAMERHASPTQLVRINGISLRMRVGTTNDSVGQVLDAFEARCRQSSARPSEALLEQAHRVVGAAASWFDGVLRSEQASSGRVACFDAGGVRLGAPALAARLKDFSKDLDAAHFGVLRYVAVRRNSHSTTYVSIVSEGSLPLTAAFSGTHDAPGTDAMPIPRPTGCTRVLSVSVDAAPYGVQLYRAPSGDALSVLDDYRRTLMRAGFSIDTAGTDAARAAHAASYGLHASKPGSSLEVRAARDASGRAMLSVVSAP